MKAQLAAVAVALSALSAGASDFGRAAAGTAGAEFLLLDTSARGIAMGGAYSAATNDASSLYWNPAGLSQVPRLSATFLHAQYIAGVTYNATSVARRVNDSSVLAFGVATRLRRDHADRHQWSFQRRVSLFLPRRARLGPVHLRPLDSEGRRDGRPSYLNTDLLEHAHGYGGDLGLHSRFYGTSQTYDVSLVLQNLGVGQRFDKVRDTLPTRLRFGGGVRAIKPLLLTIEGIAPINNSPYGAAGMEYTVDIQKNIQGAVRAGLNTMTYDSLGMTSILNFGFGVKMSDLSFDYAFAPAGELGGQIHRVSVSFNLPAKISRRYRER